MVAPVGSGYPVDSDPGQGASHRFSEADHPPKVVQRLYSVVVVAHPVAKDRGVAQFVVPEPS